MSSSTTDDTQIITTHVDKDNYYAKLLKLKDYHKRPYQHACPKKPLPDDRTEAQLYETKLSHFAYNILKRRTKAGINNDKFVKLTPSKPEHRNNQFINTIINMTKYEQVLYVFNENKWKNYGSRTTSAKTIMENVENLVNQSFQCYDNGNFDEALKIWDKAYKTGCDGIKKTKEEEEAKKCKRLKNLEDLKKERKKSRNKTLAIDKKIAEAKKMMLDR